jgi:hypothetical protein
MTAVLDRVPVERISERARAASPGHVVLTVIAAVLMGAGWLAFQAWKVIGKVLAAGWFAAAWTGSAVAEGWVSAQAAHRAGAS